jgi:hypothetical protein
MWSWHWSPLTETSLLLSPCDGLASFLETTLANGVKVVEKVITSKFRFHLIAIYALGCFCNFSCTPVPKLPWRAPTPMRLVKEWILMLLIKKTINLKTVYILISDVFFSWKNVTKFLGHHNAIWASDSNFKHCRSMYSSLGYNNNFGKKNNKCSTRHCRPPLM